MKRSEKGPPAENLDAMLATYGELMSGESLRLALGYRSERSFLRAAKAGATPVPVVQLPPRRGRFARTRDVAQWLATLSTQPSPDA